MNLFLGSHFHHPLRIYKIPIRSLSGEGEPTEQRIVVQPPTPTLLSPAISVTPVYRSASDGDGINALELALHLDRRMYAGD